MGFSNLRIRDQVLLLTLPPLIVLLTAVGLFFYTYRLVNQTTFSNERSQLVAMRAGSLLRGVGEMHSRLQEYAFTGNAAFLEGYETASNAVFQDFTLLRDVAAGDSSMIARLDAIQKDVRDWQNQWAEPAIGQVKAGQAAEAAAAMAKGSRRFSAIQEELTQFRQANQRAASARRNRNESAIHQ
ncbi:MAG: CHASE3 domain-containing protein, partial [Acidobacteriota bacterium]